MTTLGETLQNTQPIIAKQLIAQAGTLWSKFPEEASLDDCRGFEEDLRRRGIEIEVFHRGRIKAFVSAFADAGCATIRVCRGIGFYNKPNPKQMNGNRMKPKKSVAVPISIATICAKKTAQEENKPAKPEFQALEFTYGKRELPLSCADVKSLVLFGESCGLEFSEKQKLNHSEILRVLSLKCLIQPSSRSPKWYPKRFAKSIGAEPIGNDNSNHCWWNILVSFFNASVIKDVVILRRHGKSSSPDRFSRKLDEVMAKQFSGK